MIEAHALTGSAKSNAKLIITIVNDKAYSGYCKREIKFSVIYREISINRELEYGEGETLLSANATQRR